MIFDTLETIERNSDSIDKLTSLVSKLNMKMDKSETQYKPQVYKVEGEDRINMTTDKKLSNQKQIIQSRWNTYYRGRGNFDRNYRSNYRGRSRDNYR